MITLTAKIDILPADNGSLSVTGTSSGLSSNIISATLENVVGNKFNYDNPFMLGVSNIGEDRFTDETKEKQYFLGMENSNKYGVFNTPIVFYVSDSTKEIKSLTFAFDTENNRHPNNIIVDGVEYTDDDAIFTVGNLTPKSSHSIQINNWNTPNYPLVITGIYSNISIEIDRRNLISLETSLYDRSDLKLPSFGIISNNGNIEFNDYNGEVRDYAEQLLLQKGLKCEIKLHNTLVENAEKTVAIFETDKWTYNNDKQNVSVSLKDDLEEWQNIEIEPMYVDIEKPERKRLSEYYIYLWEITKEKYNMPRLALLDEITKEHLKSVYVEQPILKKSSLWAAWQKLCVAGQLHIYKENNIVKCRYNGGN